MEMVERIATYGDFFGQPRVADTVSDLFRDVFDAEKMAIGDPSLRSDDKQSYGITSKAAEWRTSWSIASPKTLQNLVCGASSLSPPSPPLGGIWKEVLYYSLHRRGACRQKRHNKGFASKYVKTKEIGTGYADLICLLYCY